MSSGIFMPPPQENDPGAKCLLGRYNKDTKYKLRNTIFIVDVSDCYQPSWTVLTSSPMMCVLLALDTELVALSIETSKCTIVCV